jgi:hypothetical protein
VPWARVLGPARRLSRELLIVAGGILLYFGGRGLTESDPLPAREHAQDLVALERSLGIFWEPALQGLTDGSHALVTLANWVYIWGHWPVIALTLGWLLMRHPAQYRRTRNAMAVSGAIGMVVFVLYPVAPPRLVDLGLVDTVSVHSEAYRVLQPPAFTNLYAAMPSLHVGWNLLMGIAIATTARHRLPRAVGHALPWLMVAAVVLTANHYVVDVLAGAAVALTGLGVAVLMERRAGRPAPARGEPGSGGRRGQAVLLGAHAEDALGRRAEGVRAAVADLAGDRTDRRVRLAQQVRREGETPVGEERHRWLPHQLGEPAGQRRPGDTGRLGQGGNRPVVRGVVVQHPHGPAHHRVTQRAVPGGGRGVGAVEP